MSSELATVQKPKNALMALADRLSIDPEKLQATLKKTVFKNCKTDEELAVMVAVSNEYGLNPLTKQIYAFPAKGGGVEPIVSIDGWLKIINSNPNFDGMEVVVADDGSEATCTIHVKGRSHPTVITEYYDECYRNTDPWNNMKKRMMRNKVIIQCGRVAFGICGIYDEDEGQEVSMKNVTPGYSDPDKEVIESPEPIAPFASKSGTEKKVDAKPAATATLNAENSEASTYAEGSLRLFIKDVTVSSGSKNNGQKYTLYKVEVCNDRQAVEAYTFSNTIGKEAQNLKGQWAMVLMEKEEKGVKLLGLQAITNTAETESVEGGIA